MKRLLVLLAFLLAVSPYGWAAQINRTNANDIQSGQPIRASAINAELNQLVNESNSQDTRLTTLESGTATISGTKTFSGTVTIGDSSGGLAPAGAVIPFAGSSAPTGWLLCYGQAVSRTTYATLFALVGTTYGAGDGSTTFNLPDLRGRTVIGKDDMGGSAASRITSASTGGANAATLGGVGGAQTHTLTESEMPAHTHSQTTYSASSVFGAGGSAARVNMTSGTTGSTGGGAAHSNTQPWMALNYIIKY